MLARLLHFSFRLGFAFFLWLCGLGGHFIYGTGSTACVRIGVLFCLRHVGALVRR